ncbi:MAG: MoaD/ThiS family protein [Pirellulales bacterium]
MKITVQFTTQLKATLGHSSEELDLESPASVGDAIAHLRKIHGHKLCGLLYDERGELLPSVLVCVGDGQISADNASESELNEGECVTLLSAISGG